MNWNELGYDIHHNDNKKWWFDSEGNPSPRSAKVLDMLIISELAEAMEGDRKDLMDDKLPHRKMVEVELADAVIRRLDKMVGLGEDQFRNDFGLNFAPSDNTAEFLYDAVKIITDKSCAQVFVSFVETFCKIKGYDLVGAIDEKRAFNRVRKDHSTEERAKANGKKY